MLSYAVIVVVVVLIGAIAIATAAIFNACLLECY